jgi:hypothetical protein
MMHSLDYAARARTSARATACARKARHTQIHSCLQHRAGPLLLPPHVGVGPRSGECCLGARRRHGEVHHRPAAQAHGSEEQHPQYVRDRARRPRCASAVTTLACTLLRVVHREPLTPAASEPRLRLHVPVYCYVVRVQVPVALTRALVLPYCQGSRNGMLHRTAGSAPSRRRETFAASSAPPAR